MLTDSKEDLQAMREIPEVERALRRKELQRAKAKELYDRLNFECNAIRATLNILLDDGLK